MGAPSTESKVAAKGVRIPEAGRSFTNNASAIQGSTLQAVGEEKTEVVGVLEKELEALKSRLSSLEMEMDNDEKGLALSAGDEDDEEESGAGGHISSESQTAAALGMK